MDCFSSSARLGFLPQVLGYRLRSYLLLMLRAAMPDSLHPETVACQALLFLAFQARILGWVTSTFQGIFLT